MAKTKIPAIDMKSIRRDIKMLVESRTDTWPKGLLPRTREQWLTLAADWSTADSRTVIADALRALRIPAYVYARRLPHERVELIMCMQEMLLPGGEKEIIERAARATQLQEVREEMNEYFMAGMLLMREVMKARLRENPTVAAIAMQHTNVGIKSLAPYVDAGVMHLRPDALALYADAVVAKIKAQKEQDG